MAQELTQKPEPTEECDMAEYTTDDFVSDCGVEIKGVSRQAFDPTFANPGPVTFSAEPEMDIRHGLEKRIPWRPSDPN